VYALDTNVLVRLLVADDPVQAAQAERFIVREQRAGSPVLVSLMVVLEAEWVLRSRYALSKAAIADALSALLDTEAIEVEDEGSLARALHRWRESGGGFVDCLLNERHLALGARATVTFDRQAAKRTGMRLLPLAAGKPERE
jgi:predicted nucleic-acid-binding protein